jgi:hypothetical protein
MTKYIAKPLFALILLMLSSCEIPTKLKMEDGNPPRIILSGSGQLGRLVISGPRNFRKISGPDYSAYWYIEYDRGDERNVRGLSPIKYGEIPSGYKQKYPESGNAPPLSDEGVYYIQIDTVNAPGASGYFSIRNGKLKFAQYEYELSEKTQ